MVVCTVDLVTNRQRSGMVKTKIGNPSVSTLILNKKAQAHGRMEVARAVTI